MADVGTFLVDDAHAALATVREKFTLTLSRARHEKAFNELLDLFLPTTCASSRRSRTWA
ncbi:hypothetical protein [Streptomyces sp. 900105755]